MQSIGHAPGSWHARTNKHGCVQYRTNWTTRGPALGAYGVRHFLAVHELGSTGPVRCMLVTHREEQPRAMATGERIEGVDTRGWRARPDPDHTAEWLAGLGCRSRCWIWAAGSGFGRQIPRPNCMDPWGRGVGIVALRDCPCARISTDDLPASFGRKGRCELFRSEFRRLLQTAAL